MPFRWLLLSCLAALAPWLHAQCVTTYRSSGGLPGTDGEVRAVAWWDPDGPGPRSQVLVLGGDFRTAGTAVANRLATYDPATGIWSALAAGFADTPNTTVYAIAGMPNGDLIVGGLFTAVGGVAANNIARWNGTSWSALGSGCNNFVLSLAVLPNGTLVAGGLFSAAGGVLANGVARWSGASWSALGSGVTGGSSNGVRAMAVLPSGDLVVGGSFANAGGTAAANLARWNGTNWSALGAGVDNWVLALQALPNGQLLAGGYFTQAGGAAALRVARWDGVAWFAVGGGVPNTPYALAALPNGDLVAGGPRDMAFNDTFLKRWDGTGWSDVAPSGASPQDAVMALAVLPNGELLAAGRLNAGTVSHNVGRWNGATWSSLAPALSAPVSTLLALPNGDLVGGGLFTSFGATGLSYIGRWNGSGWQPLGAGMNAAVAALTLAGNGDLVAGGNFTTAGGQPANHVARWDGTGWSPLGSGTSGSAFSAGYVLAMATLANGDLVAGGMFATAGGVPAPGIARWNGTNWSSLGAGMNGQVWALRTLPNGDLVAGGSFTMAGGVPANGVARWNGSSWSALGAGVASTVSSIPVRALATLANGDLVVAGAITSAGGAPANRIARWNGTSWAPLGSGLNDLVHALALAPNGDLLAAGAFTQAGGQPAQRIARWNGTAWSAIGAGVAGGTGGFGQVNALAALPGGVAVAGDFTQAGGQPANYWTVWGTNCVASAIPGVAGCAGSGGANVLTAVGLPWLGQTFRADGTGLPPVALACVVTGLSTLALPLAGLLSQGQPGCTLGVAPDVIGSSLITTGAVSTTLAIPNTPTLAGIAFHQQLVLLDLGASGAATATNALAMTIGSF